MKGWLAVMEGDETTPGLAEWTNKVLCDLEGDLKIRLDTKHPIGGLIQAIDEIEYLLVTPPNFTRQTAINDSVDLMSYYDIWNDNTATITYIFKTLLLQVVAEDDSSSLKIIQILTTHRPQVSRQSNTERKTDLNPHQRTWLELLAQAPFAYFGSKGFSRDFEKFKKRANTDNPNEFLPTDFLYHITRKNFTSSTSPPLYTNHLKRHGGCPALHSKYKNLDLINRLGLIYYKALCEWYEEKYGANALAAVTATEIREVVECPHQK